MRIVEDGDAGLQLTYWSAPEGFLGPWAAFVRDHNDSRIYANAVPRRSSPTTKAPPAEILPALRTGPKTTSRPMHWRRGFPLSGP